MTNAHTSSPSFWRGFNNTLSKRHAELQEEHQTNHKWQWKSMPLYGRWTICLHHRWGSMPVTFEILSSDEKTSCIISTDHCGTCDEFWHRSIRAGGCRIDNKKGEISIDEPKCCAWILKSKYKSAVEHEVKIAQGLLWQMMEHLLKGHSSQHTDLKCNT